VTQQRLCVTLEDEKSCSLLRADQEQQAAVLRLFDCLLQVGNRLDGLPARLDDHHTALQVGTICRTSGEHVADHDAVIGLHVQVLSNLGRQGLDLKAKPLKAGRIGTV
jgi:hypothetical protein